MMRAVTTLVAGLGLLAAPALASAQRNGGDPDIGEERAAVAAWTACIADENRAEASALLNQDFTSSTYQDGLKKLALTKVSKGCFSAMPLKYRSIRLGGLPFAGGLAERLIESDSTPLAERLVTAANGREAATFSPTDGMAMCIVRKAPTRVAGLFEAEAESAAENAAIVELLPVAKACLGTGENIEISAFAVRSMLATASFRLLAAQVDEDNA